MVEKKSVEERLSEPVDRRQFVQSSLASLAMLPVSGPALITRDSLRPQIDCGIASGDLSVDGAVVWSKTDRPARMRVEWSTHRDFRSTQTVFGPDALAASDYTAKVGLKGLPEGAEIFYRVSFEDLVTGHRSAPQLGRFRTPDPAGSWPTRFAWSGDVGGQGYGINPKIGGMTIFESMRAMHPDLFIHCGDVIYADAPLRKVKMLGPGRYWHNLVTPEKRKVAETLNEFRGNFKYNLLDANLRRFNAEVPTAYTWDDHETKNNWWPGRELTDGRYRIKSCDLLGARARAAFFEYCPMAFRQSAPGRIYRRLSQGPHLDVFVVDSRSYRGRNSRNRQEQMGPSTAFWGAPQLSWLCRNLVQSQATWKLIATPQPLSLIIGHRGDTIEGAANGLAGRPRGRELEVAELLNFIHRNKIQNVVFVTADVHYAAAHHYDPKRASFKQFTPFWEFVAGPLNAGTFGPNPMDPTFGPKLEFLSIPKGLRPGTSPLSGHQFFGLGQIDPITRSLTVSLHDAKGNELWSRELPPAA